MLRSTYVEALDFDCETVGCHSNGIFLVYGCFWFVVHASVEPLVSVHAE